MILSLTAGCGSAAKQYSVLVKINAAGAGTVKIAKNPSGEFTYTSLKAIAEIDSDSNFIALYAQGTMFVLAAKPEAGYVFDSWGDDLSGTSDTISFTLNTNMSITANFKAASPTSGNQGEIPSSGSQVSSVTTLDKNHLIAGDHLAIHSVLKYIGDGTSVSGIPAIIISNQLNHQIIAAWYLNQGGNYLSEFSQTACYSIVKNTPIVLDATWDLVNSNTGDIVPDGGYAVQATIAVPQGNGMLLLANSEPAININKFLSGTPPDSTPSVVPNQPGVDVSAHTTLSSTHLNAGDTLAIHTELKYSGAEASVTGLPVIMMFDANWNVVANWCLSADGHILTNYNASDAYTIVKNTPYIMDITWDQLKAGVHVPDGQYHIQVTISVPNDTGFSMLVTNEGAFSVTVGATTTP
jgi:hypothetical protein